MIEKISCIVMTAVAVVYLVLAVRSFMGKGNYYNNKMLGDNLTEEQKKKWYSRTGLLNLLIAAVFMLNGIYLITELGVILAFCTAAAIAMFTCTMLMYIKASYK